MNHKKALKKAFERIIIITLLSVFLGLFFVSVLNDMYAFVKSSDKATISLDEPVTLPELARLISRRGIIKNPTVFSLFVRAKGRRQRLESFVGEVTLSGDMSYREIMLALS